MSILKHMINSCKFCKFTYSDKKKMVDFDGDEDNGEYGVLAGTII